MEESEKLSCEQELNLAKARLQTIAQQTESWLWETDENHLFCFFTDNLQQLTSLKKTDLLGTNRHSLALKSEGDHWVKHAKDLSLQRPFQNFRYILKSVDGDHRHLNVTGWPVYDEKGNFAGYRGTGKDETAEVMNNRRQSEKEQDLLSTIENQQARHATVLENLSQSVMWFDAQGSILLNNAQTAKLLNFTEAEYSQVRTIDQHLRLMAERGDFGEVDIEKEVAERSHRLRIDQNEPITYRIHLESSDRYLDVDLRPLPDGSRILTHTDVTEEARKDFKVTEREAMLSTVIDNVDYGIVFMDENLHCDVVNNRFCEMWGMDFEFVNQKPEFDQLLEYNRYNGIYDVDCYNDEEWDRYVRQRRETVSSLTDGEVKTMEMARKDGRYFTLSIVSLSGGSRMITYYDITSIKQLEMALRKANNDLEFQLQELFQREAVLDSLVNNIDYGTLVLDKDQKVELANKKFRELMNIDQVFLDAAPTMAEVLDRMYENQCTGMISGNPADWPDYRASVVEQIRIGKFAAAERLRQDGKTILSSCIALPDGKRMVTYFDLTLQKHREAQLEAMQNDLAQANELLEHRVEQRTSELRATQSMLVRKERQALLGELVASLCHELRNPLNALNSSLFLVRRNVEADYPKLSKAFDRSERTIKRCTNILNDLYDYALVDGLDRQPTAIGPLVNNIIEQVRVPDGFEFELDVSEELPVCDIDGKQLGGALEKIITNAVQAIAEDHNPNTEPKIVVYVGNCGDFIEMIISDNGPGMHDEVFAKALEPLYSTRGFGVGLGLPIAEQIIKRHNGEIKLETLKDAGTTVTIWLPTSEAVNAGTSSLKTA